MASGILRNMTTSVQALALQEDFGEGVVVGGEGVEVGLQGIGAGGEEGVEIEAGDKTFVAGESDVIGIPSWYWRRMRASKDAIIFTFSDRSAQEKLAIYREEYR